MGSIENLKMSILLDLFLYYDMVLKIEGQAKLREPNSHKVDINDDLFNYQFRYFCIVKVKLRVFLLQVTLTEVRY